MWKDMWALGQQKLPNQDPGIGLGILMLWQSYDKFWDEQTGNILHHVKLDATARKQNVWSLEVSMTESQSFKPHN